MIDPTPIDPTPTKNALNSIAQPNGSKKQMSPVTKTVSASKNVCFEPRRPMMYTHRSSPDMLAT
ncbi:hypothetical protein ACKC2P_05490 [Exiguobacterium chiriqhucha]